MDIKYRIKKCREDKGFSQEKLAKLIGKHKGTVSNWEQGIREPKFKQIEKICMILGISESEFYCDIDPAILRIPKEIIVWVSDPDVLSVLYSNDVRDGIKTIGKNKIKYYDTFEYILKNLNKLTQERLSAIRSIVSI